MMFGIRVPHRLALLLGSVPLIAATALVGMTPSVASAQALNGHTGTGKVSAQAGGCLGSQTGLRITNEN